MNSITNGRALLWIHPVFFRIISIFLILLLFRRKTLFRCSWVILNFLFKGILKRLDLTVCRTVYFFLDFIKFKLEDDIYCWLNVFYQHKEVQLHNYLPFTLWCHSFVHSTLMAWNTVILAVSSFLFEPKIYICNLCVKNLKFLRVSQFIEAGLLACNILI